MKDEYYVLREWDVETGLQTREKLASLDIDDIGQALHQMKWPYDKQEEKRLKSSLVSRRFCGGA